MATRKRSVTTARPVTSMRLEPVLKERLRKLSGEPGYQTLVRDVLWQFVEQLMGSGGARSTPLELRQGLAGAATHPLGNSPQSMRH